MVSDPSVIFTSCLVVINAMNGKFTNADKDFTNTEVIYFQSTFDLLLTHHLLHHYCKKQRAIGLYQIKNTHNQINIHIDSVLLAVICLWTHGVVDLRDHSGIL